jgi:hypothetical protein
MKKSLNGFHSINSNISSEKKPSIIIFKVEKQAQELPKALEPPDPSDFSTTNHNHNNIHSEVDGNGRDSLSTSNHNNINHLSLEDLNHKGKIERKKQKNKTKNSGFLDHHKCNFPQCEKIYKNIENLNIHVKNKHYNLKPYKCSFCELRFSYRNGKNNKKFKDFLFGIFRQNISYSEIPFKLSTI